MDSTVIKAKLMAGAAQIDITPRLGTQIDGDIGRRRPAELVLEPIYAKALVLQNGDEKACILSLDLLCANKEWSDKVRAGAEERYGIKKENVIVHAMQNHSTPSLGHIMVTETNNLFPQSEDWAWTKGSEINYTLSTLERIFDVIDEAVKKLQPANIGMCRGIDGRFAFNRRYVMRDGTSTMLPGRCNEDILYVEGPSDPEVGVALITNDNLENIAVLLHHTCHPVHGYPMNYISSGWPGAWSKSMKEVLGDSCVPLVINGCCGNVYHDNHTNPDHDPEDYKGMGAGLAQTSVKALKKLKYLCNPVLSVKSKHLQIPLREITEEKLEKARQMLKEYPMPKWDDRNGRLDWDWWYAMSIVDIHSHWGRNASFDYEIQALRIGDFSMVALGGEPFVEGQLKIKLGSPAPYTFVAHMCNYYLGYVPTQEAMNRGGYETWTCIGSKLYPGALDMIADASVELIKELFGQEA